jgi:hypothetical protein
MKKSLGVTAAIIVFLTIVGFVLWWKFRNPYDNRYFSTEMQMKYLTVESVLGALGEGWRYDTDRHVELLDEAYGFSLVKRYGRREPQYAAMASVKEIKYYKSKKLAVVNFEPTNPESMGQAWWFIWRKGRWVFYPETPWLWLLEFFRGE